MITMNKIKIKRKVKQNKIQQNKKICHYIATNIQI